MQQKFLVKKVAVLGAGIMGVQVAAHCVNSGIPVILFDLAGTKDSPNFIVKETITALLHINPRPLVSYDLIKYITPANYSFDLDKLIDCDLIIESITENYTWKSDLYNKIVPYINNRAVLATNTSGLNIYKLAENLPENLSSRFVGMHFFNPPRFMKLVELLPNTNTPSKLLDDLEEFLVTNLGNGVIRVKNSPNFIANRVATVFSLLVMHHASKLGLPIDIVDSLTGKLIGRPKTATYKLLDLIGLDSFARIVETMHRELHDDPWHKLFVVPEWITNLINKSYLGNKTGIGIYKKSSGRRFVFDIEDGNYRQAINKNSLEIEEILALKDPYSWFLKLKQSKSVEANFLWNVCRDFLHYISFHKASIANNIFDIDLALKWGYGWQLGPFEAWRMAGWHEVLQLIHEDIKQNNSIVNINIAPLPEWVYNFSGEYKKNISPLSVYKKQWNAENIIGESLDTVTIIQEDLNLKLWTIDNDVAILSFKTFKNYITSDLIDSMQESVNLAIKNYQGLIIYANQGDSFSYGLNKEEYILDLISIKKLQNLCFKIKTAKIPVVTAAYGNVYGPALELLLYSDKSVVALETYLGFNKVNSSFKLPFGGGITEIIKRCSILAAKFETSVVNFLKSYCRAIVQNRISLSAKDNIASLYLKTSDAIVINKNEILFKAHKEIYNLLDNNYLPPLDTYSPIEVGGSKAILELENTLEEMLETEQIFTSSYKAGLHLAKILSGGNVIQGTLLNVRDLLLMEQKAALEIYAASSSKSNEYNLA